VKAKAAEDALKWREWKRFFVAVGIAAGALKGVSVAAAAALGAFLAGIKEDNANDVAKKDPLDPHWRSIVRAKPIGLVRVPSIGFLGSAGTSALQAIAREMAKVDGLEYALSISHNRRTSAQRAHNSVWVKRQTAAMGRFAIEAGDASTALITLIQQSTSTLSAPFPGLTAANLKHAKRYVRAHGLPPSFVRLATKYGLPSSLLAAAKQTLTSAAALPSYATSMYGLLSYPPLITAEQQAANALLAYGQLLVAHP
jgi:hypothetical protein